MARTEPLASLLEIPDDVEHKTDTFWPGHANPDKARMLFPINIISIELPSQVTDADLKAWIRRNAEPNFHAVITSCTAHTARLNYWLTK